MGLPCILFHICHILRRHVERTKLHFLPHRNELSLALPHGGSGGKKSMAFGGWDFYILLGLGVKIVKLLVGKFWGIDCLIDPNSSRSMHTGAIGCPPKATKKKISGPGFVSSGKFRQV